MAFVVVYSWYKIKTKVKANYSAKLHLYLGGAALLCTGIAALAFGLVHHKFWQKLPPFGPTREFEYTRNTYVVFLGLAAGCLISFACTIFIQLGTALFIAIGVGLGLGVVHGIVQLAGEIHFGYAIFFELAALVFVIVACFLRSLHFKREVLRPVAPVVGLCIAAGIYLISLAVLVFLTPKCDFDGAYASTCPLPDEFNHNATSQFLQLIGTIVFAASAIMFAKATQAQFKTFGPNRV
eukprot:tig00020930_g16023.t1